MNDLESDVLHAAWARVKTVEDAARRYLAVDGSHGVYDALALHEARKELVALVGTPEGYSG